MSGAEADASSAAVLGSPLPAGSDWGPSRGREGGDRRLRLRGAYWPCLLSWERAKPTGSALDRIRKAARRWESRSTLIAVDGSTHLLLLAAESLGGPDRRWLREAVSAVVEVAKAEQPSAEVRAVIGDPVRRGVRLAALVSRLRRLGHRAAANGGDTLVWAERHSLVCLLDVLDPSQVSAFIERQLAGLRAYDHAHGTDLQRVLELSLDHDSRNDAARAAFMHRNTFRRQLRRAVELTDVDLDSPEERLALHLALKMRALAPATGRRDARSSRARLTRAPGSHELAATSRAGP